MYETDYILRVIQQAGIFLRAMLAELREQRPGEVIETSRDALLLLLGTPPTLAESLTPDGLVAILSAGGEFDVKRGRLAAEVFVRRSQASAMQGEPSRATSERAKAERLIALVLGSGDEDDVAEALALREELDSAGAPT